MLCGFEEKAARAGHWKTGDEPQGGRQVGLLALGSRSADAGGRQGRRA